MLKGKIQNINSTKYMVLSDDKIYDCTVRGVFRNEKITPLVGDNVEFDEKQKRIDKILPRKNYLTRPNIANVDVAIIMCSVKNPDLDLFLLDKLLVNIEFNNITPMICFSKNDLLDDTKDIDNIINYYNSIGIYSFVNTDYSFLNKLNGKIVVICGQTGSGKSTFLNKLDSSLNLKTSEVSNVLGRGKHTTRMVSLYKVNNTLIADTPGFSLLDLNDLSKQDIRGMFHEFNDYDCKYRDCMHINTDGCNLKKHIGKEVLESRYNNYLEFLKEKDESSSKLF